MNYPISGNVSLGNVSGNIKLYINDAGTSNLTGIGYNNNSLTFGVNQSVTATPEMVINPSGNVGIGTTNPLYPLDVTGNIRLGVGTTGNIRFGNSGVGSTQAGYIDLLNNNMTIMNHQNGYLALGTNNSEDMRILTNGNVGIGTVNPQGTLHIASSRQNSVTVMIKDISNNNNLLRLVGNLSTGGYNDITQNNDVGIFYGDSYNPNPRSLVIAPHAIGPSGIRMDTNGNVGIGTSNPASTLDVNGSAHITGSVSFYKLNSSSTYTNGGMFMLSKQYFGSNVTSLDTLTILTNSIYGSGYVEFICNGTVSNYGMFCHKIEFSIMPNNQQNVLLFQGATQFSSGSFTTVVQVGGASPLVFSPILSPGSLIIRISSIPTPSYEFTCFARIMCGGAGPTGKFYAYFS